MNANSIADAFRRWGYLQADLDPLGRLAPFPHPDLDDLPAAEAARWRRTYCGPIGVEFMHMPHPDRCAWVAGRMEAPAPEPDRMYLLERLASAELFERFLHSRYVGTKRYSLEGAAGVIPLLDAVLDAAAANGAELAVLGMSHRGRMCILAKIAAVPESFIFAGFEDVDPRSVLGSGDVKYHRGATGKYRTASGAALEIHLVSNPSHLEAIDPVIVGRVRARQTRIGPDGRRKVLPITLHGDAAFAGQGIAAETLNLAGLAGFSVGGSIHVIVNNLIGFTATPAQLHSSRFASDMAKRLAIPIFHVNGLDPDAVARAGRMALEYRAAFGSDVVIDLICYRRYGHSEVEDPTTTQPILYRKIEALPQLWRDYAVKCGFGEDVTRPIEARIMAAYEEQLKTGRAMTKKPSTRVLPAFWDRYVGGLYERALEVDTAVPADRLRGIAETMAAAPEGFNVHPKLRKVLEQRRQMGEGSRAVDWATAEALAFGSLLREGVPVRLAGQDSRRGTFNQRHAVLFDYDTGAEHVSLAHIAPDQAWFGVYDTALSEASCLGFEYGFSREYPEALILWEAQFGDFANGAQIIIDQFLAAGEDKWQILSGLVMLLPHGYEGQGPEHSSARLERYLELAGEDNIQVCQPSTAAQYFHLLRRQALRTWRKPLIVMTPKGLLRAAAVCSSLGELAEGRFRPVIPDEEAREADRVLIASGKVVHDLRIERARRGDARIGIIALEQLYPFPDQEILNALARHPKDCEVVWVQEEPANMGAVRYVRPILERLTGHHHIMTVKRSASASPATGSAKAHAIEQETLLRLAFTRYV